MLSILFGALLLLLVAGVPVGFSIGLSVLLYLLFGSPFPPDVVIQRSIAGVNSFPLLALPLFILAGYLMEHGSTPRLMRLANDLLGWVPGGLAVVDVVGSAFFGAVSGSGVATIAAMGAIMEPEMVRQGYPRGYVAALQAASGSLGVLIPPSITMVIFGLAGGVSIGALLVAGIIPGLITAVLLIGAALVVARRGDYSRTPRPDGRRLLRSFLDALLPLMMPAIILGGILAGIFTATEAAAVAAVYAFVLSAFVYRELSWRELTHAVTRSVVTSTMILIIMALAAAFGWIITVERVPNLVGDWLFRISAGLNLMVIVLIQLVLIVLGTFMETTAIIIVTTPIFLPIAVAAGLDPLVYAVMMTLNLMIGAITPPLAVGLYTASSILSMPVEETFRYVLPFIVALGIAIVLHYLVTDLTLVLPRQLLGYR